MRGVRNIKTRARQTFAAGVNWPLSEYRWLSRSQGGRGGEGGGDRGLRAGDEEHEGDGEQHHGPRHAAEAFRRRRRVLIAAEKKRREEVGSEAIRGVNK